MYACSPDNKATGNENTNRTPHMLPTTPHHRWLLSIAMGALVLTALLHWGALALSGTNALITPIAELSRPPWGVLHTVGLSCFALAHLLLALAITGRDQGRLWPLAQIMLMVNALAIAVLSWQFARAGIDAHSPQTEGHLLWLIASLAGITMALLWPGLRRRGTRIALLNQLITVVWLLLVPLGLWLGPDWIGAYERLVGAIYLCWLGALTVAEWRSTPG